MSKKITKNDRARFIDAMDRKWYRKYRQKIGWQAWDEVVEPPRQAAWSNMLWK